MEQSAYPRSAIDCGARTTAITDLIIAFQFEENNYLLGLVPFPGIVPAQLGIAFFRNILYNIFTCFLRAIPNQKVMRRLL